MDKSVIITALTGNTRFMEMKNMKSEENRHQIGNATYFVERVFTGEKTPRQVVVEEIITTVVKEGFFDHAGRKMV